MKIEVQKHGDKKKIKFIGKINMAQEIVLSKEDSKKLSKALDSDKEISFETE